jgi:predicted phosphoribosyltransferase/pimeloyl-ACP methyl ester carboxylesterase
MPGTAIDVTVPVGTRQLNGTLCVPAHARGVVLFAHGSGSSRLSPRNKAVAKALNEAGFATLLMDLLEENEADDRGMIFDIELLANRLAAAIDWVAAAEPTRGLPIGLFGASTGAAAAIEAARRRPAVVRAIVSRGGRPDLAWMALQKVKAPTLLIVGECDPEVLQLNRTALRRLGGVRELRIVPGAGHLFEERGALQRVAVLARDWFAAHIPEDDPPTEAGRFADRTDAGRRLAARLAGRVFTDPMVLAIPRGGIVLGVALAEKLNADLDVVLSRKLRMPGNPEYALGAISETGDVYLNVDEEAPPIVKNYLDEECRHQMEEIARRRKLFRKGRGPAPIAGRSVIVTDDGIATGSTMIAALRTIRLQHPLELIVAVPVAAPDRLRQVAKECDEVVCLNEAPDLMAVGEYYEDFTQVEDEEVVAAVDRFAGRAVQIQR